MNGTHLVRYLRVLTALARADHEPTTEDVCEAGLGHEARYCSHARTLAELRRLVRDDLAIRVQRRHERVTRWQATALGLDLIEQVRGLCDAEVSA